MWPLLTDFGLLARNRLQIRLPGALLVQRRLEFPFFILASMSQLVKNRHYHHHLVLAVLVSASKWASQGLRQLCTSTTKMLVMVGRMVYRE
jgi:hypothetical protein